MKRSRWIVRARGLATVVVAAAALTAACGSDGPPEKKAAELEKKADVHVSEDARRLARRELRKIRRVVARGGT